MKRTELADGDKTHIELKIKGFVSQDGDKTEFDLDIDLKVDQVDYRHLAGELVHAIRDDQPNGKRITRPAKATAAT